MKSAEEQQLRRQLIKDFLDFLNSCSDLFVLKGGTALMMCYGLDRFSEDIDLDMLSSDKTVMQNILQKYCSKTGYTFRTAKQTNTTERYILHYDDEYIDVKKLENNLLELLFSLEIIKENKQEKENIR